MKKLLPILRCYNTETFEVIECRCSRKRMRKKAYDYSKNFKYKNIKIMQVDNWAFKTEVQK